jgi:hypothetical protein
MWGIVDSEKHAHGRFIDGNGRKGFRILVIRNGVAYFESIDAHNGANVTTTDRIHIGLAKSIEDHQGNTLVSEGLDANYYDMINYAMFCLIRLVIEKEQSND